MAPAQGWHAKSWSVPHFLAALPVSFNRCNMIWCLFFKVLKNKPKLDGAFKVLSEAPMQVQIKYLFIFVWCWTYLLIWWLYAMSSPYNESYSKHCKESIHHVKFSKIWENTISAIYCLGIWCLTFSNLNVLGSPVHILKLERYRED